MGRGKLKMELIKEEKSRAKTFNRRKMSLVRQAYELSILCDVKVGMIIYGPQLNNNHAEIWPSDSRQVKEVISLYKQKTLKDGNKPMGLNDYYVARKRTADGEITKLREANSRTRFPRWDDSINNLSADQLVGLLAKLGSKISACHSKIMEMKADQYVMEDHRSGFFVGSSSRTGLRQSVSNLPQPLDFFQRSSKLDQGILSSQQQQPYHEPDPQMVSFGLDISSIDNMKLLTNVAEFTQFSDASTSNATTTATNSATYSPLTLPVYYDGRAAAAWANPFGVYVPHMQMQPPVLSLSPYGQFPELPSLPTHQMHAPSITNFNHEINEDDATRRENKPRV